MLVPLKSLIKKLKEDNILLNKILSSFNCNKDADIEYFLRNKAVDFENISKSRTYLYCDYRKLLENQIVILGYFTLSLKVLVFPDELSIRDRKELDGFRGKIHGIPIKEIPCFLIGQLAKNSNISDNPISGKKLLDSAYSVIQSAISAVGGRFILIECQNKPKLIEFYKLNGFSEFLRDFSNNKTMVQMLKKT